MEDCELFNVSSTEIWSVVISISSIICVYLAISSKGGVKGMRKEVIIIWVHKTRNKERINVKNVKDIKNWPITKQEMTWSYNNYRYKGVWAPLCSRKAQPALFWEAAQKLGWCARSGWWLAQAVLPQQNILLRVYPLDLSVPATTIL